MQRGIGVLVLVALLLGTSAPVSAGGDDLERIREDLARLTELVEKLATRIEALEERVQEIVAESVSDAPFTGPPSGPIGFGQGRGGASPAPAGLKETSDRFTGDHRVEAPGPVVVAKHKDDPLETLRVRLTWISARKGGAAPTHDLDFEVEGKLRQWPPGTMLYMLSDGRRSSVAVSSEIVKSGGTMIESLGIVFDDAAARSFTAAKRVEVRIGKWELEIPPAFRKTASEAIRRLDADRSGN